MTSSSAFRTVLLLIALAGTVVAPPAGSVASAKEGGSGGGGSGGGDSGGSGSGSNSGSGSSGSNSGSNDSGGRGSSGRGGDDNSGRGGNGQSGRGRGGERGGDHGGKRGQLHENWGAQWFGWGQTSAETARQAVRNGQAVSLGAALAVVRAAVPGDLLEADLRRSADGGWQYEILVLSSDGRYREVTVDARRNRITQIRRR